MACYGWLADEYRLVWKTQNGGSSRGSCGACRVNGGAERIDGLERSLVLVLPSLVVGSSDLFRWARRPGLARLFSFGGLAGHLAFDEVTV